MTSLSERLNSLGLKRSSEVVPPPAKSFPTLAEIIGAKITSNNLGNVLVVEKLTPYGLQHGDVQFTNKLDILSLSRMGKLNNSDTNLDSLVFLDTETTGLAGGTGTFAFVVGVGRFVEGGFLLTQFVMDDPGEEAAVLLALENYLENAKALVTFNGKSFDVPLLKTRYVLNKLAFRFGNLEHIDLLHISRKIWRQRLESCSLKDLEREVLHLPRSDEEVPGWMIPQIYFDYLRTGDASMIRNVIYHNGMDIISLAALFIAVERLLDTSIEQSGIEVRDIFAIGQMYEGINDIGKALELYEYCSTKNEFSAKTNLDLYRKLGGIYKSQLQWEKAESLWIQNASSGSIEDCIELAMYYEHQCKDLKAAIQWTLLAETYIDSSNKPRYIKNKIKKELLHRRNRLVKKGKPNV